jgi:tRNA(Arg) A34 adenosine deaminase TadA
LNALLTLRYRETYGLTLYSSLRPCLLCTAAAVTATSVSSVTQPTTRWPTASSACQKSMHTSLAAGLDGKVLPRSHSLASALCS